MFKSYENFWRNFFNFKGTSSKSDFWWPVLINSLLFLFLKIVCDIFIDPAIVSILLYILSMPIMFGTISCITRRLRDAGYLWFNLFLGLFHCRCLGLRRGHHHYLRRGAVQPLPPDLVLGGQGRTGLPSGSGGARSGQLQAGGVRQQFSVSASWGEEHYRGTRRQPHDAGNGKTGGQPPPAGPQAVHRARRRFQRSRRAGICAINLWLNSIQASNV